MLSIGAKIIEMEAAAKLVIPSSSKRQRCIEFDWDLCTVCQKQTSEPLVVTKSDLSYEKLYTCISQRAEWNDSQFTRIKKLMVDVTGDDFKSRKAQWHRTCYQSTTHKGRMELSRERASRNAQSVLENSEDQEAGGSSVPFTRAQTPAYNKSHCIFCDHGGSKRYPLHLVATDNVGEQLLKAVELNNDDKLRVRVNASINPADAHSIDVMYHKKCWNVNVINKLRMDKFSDDRSEQFSKARIASDV